MSNDRLLSIHCAIGDALSAIGGLNSALDRTINDMPELEGRGDAVTMFHALVTAQRMILREAEGVADTIWPDRGQNPQVSHPTEKEAL